MSRSRIPADWIFEEDAIKNSPSRKAGMNERDELKLKREAIDIMKKIGAEFGWKLNGATGAACVYFHRFYMLHSIQEFPCPTTSLSCLFLAGKSEETPKKCKDIAQNALKNFSHIFRVNLNQLMDDVMSMERVLLQTIKFDFTIDLPYRYIIMYANDFKSKRAFDAAMVSDIVCCAWPLVNDSFFTHLCLAWEPQIIAVSLFWLAIKLRQHEEINETKWWEEHVAELCSDKMETICHEVLDYYTLMNGGNNGGAAASG
ncbi:ccnk-1 [Pristionchus pacificus]|uniref:Ccnk-1 n=1 Tax=Pristionchus pacificus TaxID=54126 RepID=A0A2A6BRC7_PRIPA|nr:ccnk-1 [Pristionchus pacificus]|eukprot:PDM68455.1 ccnk-1 [Pristionchus pacificus]